MTRSTLLLASFVLLGPSIPAAAQDADFSLTYHIERTPAAQLSIETCGSTVADAAAQAGLRAVSQSFPGQLVTVSGGAEGRGAFVVQCIAVDDKTVSVVQGIDYQQAKGAIGDFADQAFAAVQATVR
ncbi:DUF6180 family protein [Paracoccus sp. SSJ]|uniref:DUF6180 family protein n=1 Tax=Paracoccus sp. SSJ TaxID=3050636 RepID=UPI0025501F38|nr:DUF6180 family protein [Paracoccus sp. SSJ]MDK8874352.1 DUF6180 family protein [Paracoccus sp. SSJ]